MLSMNGSPLAENAKRLQANIDNGTIILPLQNGKSLIVSGENDISLIKKGLYLCIMFYISDMLVTPSNLKIDLYTLLHVFFMPFFISYSFLIDLSKKARKDACLKLQTLQDQVFDNCTALSN